MLAENPLGATAGTGQDVIVAYLKLRKRANVPECQMHGEKIAAQT